MSDKPFQVGDEVIVFPHGYQQRPSRSRVSRVTHNGKAVWVDNVRYRDSGFSAGDGFYRTRIEHLTAERWQPIAHENNVIKARYLIEKHLSKDWPAEDLRALIALCEKNAAKKE